MSNARSTAIAFTKNYIGFLLGLVFGSIVATLTCISILGTPELDSENISDVDKLKECLFK